MVVIAGTNIPEVLDPALLRAGRFDRQVAIDNPDIRSRKSIFMVLFFSSVFFFFMFLCFFFLFLCFCVFYFNFFVLFFFVNFCLLFFLSLFQVYLKKITLSPDLNMDKVAEKLAAMSPGLSGADIAAICNEAALRAVCFYDLKILKEIFQEFVFWKKEFIL